LRLPIERPAESLDSLQQVNANLRELTFHPERFAPVAAGGSCDAAAWTALVAEKNRWVATAQARDNARRRCQAIRDINQALQSCVAQLREQWIARRNQLAERGRNEAILNWREYAFCLYPEEALRRLMSERPHASR
jgi:hypothetical protein